MAAINPCEIKDLTFDRSNTLIICVIIAKSDIWKIESAKDGDRRSVITFTVRDSKRHFINCSVWGTSSFVDTYNIAYKIGDIIVINKAKITAKKSEYLPQTSSPFELTLNEGKGFIFRKSAQEHTAISKLIGETIKSTSLALKLTDISISCQENEKTNNAFFDLLVVVRVVLPQRTVQTKLGEKSVCNVILMDNTLDTMKITFWNKECIERAEKWVSLKTILHLVDVRSTYSVFEQATVLVVTRRTIITENPIQSSRATALLEYIKKLPKAYFDKLLIQPSNKNHCFADIKDVMTVQKIFDQFEINKNNEFTAILYGVITKLEIDPHSSRSPIIKYCIHCNRYIQQNTEYCTNERCLMQLSAGKNFAEKFDIVVDLSDHSGTLNNCHLTEQNAINFLRYTIDDYKKLSEQEIEQFKWTYLLDRFAAKVHVKRGKASPTNMFISIVELTDANPEIIAENLKIY